MTPITCEKCSAVLKVETNKGVAFCEYCGVAYMLDDAIKANVVEKWTAEIDQLLKIKDWNGAAQIGKKLTDEVPTDYRAVWLYLRALTYDMSTASEDMRKVIKKVETLELINDLADRAYNLTPKEELRKYDKWWQYFAERITEYLQDHGKNQKDVFD